MITLTGDPKCVSRNGAPQRADERIVVGENQALQNVFVYVKDGWAVSLSDSVRAGRPRSGQCRYSPRAPGGASARGCRFTTAIRCSTTCDRTAWSTRFNKSTPIEGMSFNHTFATGMMVFMRRPRLMSAYVGVLDHQPAPRRPWRSW
jgi:hypothetical protein